MTDKQRIKKLEARNKRLTHQIQDWKFELGYFCKGEPTPKSVARFVRKMLDSGIKRRL